MKSFFLSLIILYFLFISSSKLLLLLMQHKNLDQQSAAREFRVTFANQTDKEWNLNGCQCLHGIFDARFPLILKQKQRTKINCLSNGFMTGAEFCFHLKMIGEELSFSGLADNPYIGSNKIGLAKGKLDYGHLRQYLNQNSPKKLEIGSIGNLRYYAIFSYIKGNKAKGDLRIIEEANQTLKSITFM